MGNFLLIMPSEANSAEGASLFHRGLDLARRLKGQMSQGSVERQWVFATTFTRENGSGSAPVVEPGTGSWLQAAGSWFHDQGFNVGSEANLLNRYLEVGADQLARELQGFFVILVGDARTKETIIITDIIGSCHCYVRTFDKMTAFSGSSLLLAGLQECNHDPVACQEFLHTGVIYEDRTLYREVRKVAPASIIRLRSGEIISQLRYWKVSNLQADSLDGKVAVQELWGQLTHAAQTIGKVFARPVCDLTGGYDSRAVVAAFFDAGIKFTATVSGSINDPDVVVSSGLSKLLGLPHLHLSRQAETSIAMLKRALQLTDGEYNLLEYSGVYQIHQTLAAQFDGSINGSFGEIARGYWWEVLFPEAGKCKPINPIQLAKKRYVTHPVDASLFSDKNRLDIVSHMAGIIERTNAGLEHLPNTTQMDNTYLVMRMHRWQGRIASSTDQVWPCVSPFMFRGVLETMLKIRSGLRRRNLLVRLMLAEFQPRMAQFPLEHGYPPIPVTWRSFYRFWPLPVHYANRALAKYGLRSCSSSQVDPLDSGGCQARIRLWEEEEVREVFRPKSMYVSSFLEMIPLERFLEGSKRPSFKSGEVWARLLTLEWTFRTLGTVRNV